jgi:hypothetical protein
LLYIYVSLDFSSTSCSFSYKPAGLALFSSTLSPLLIVVWCSAPISYCYLISVWKGTLSVDIFSVFSEL